MQFCSFVGEGMHDDSTIVFAYYKEGATNPTFLYFAHGLKEVKCWVRSSLSGYYGRVAATLSLCLCVVFLVVPLLKFVYQFAFFFLASCVLCWEIVKLFDLEYKRLFEFWSSTFL